MNAAMQKFRNKASGIRVKIALLCLGSLLLVCGRNANATTIDIMLVYDTTAATWVASKGGMATFSQDAVNRMNLAMQNSNVDINFRLVHAMSVPYTSSSLNTSLSAIQGGQGSFASVHTARNTYGADLVAMLIDTGSAYGTVGIGYTLWSWSGIPNYAYTATAIRSVEISQTLTHEVGHNLGAHHAKAQTSSDPGPNTLLTSPTAPYSAGWYFTGTNNVKYHTIMAYNYNDSVFYNEAPLFSTPLISHQGTLAGDAANGDNARLLRQTKDITAGYRTATVVTNPPGSLQFTASATTVAENNGNVGVVVSRTGGKAGSASVNYTTSPGTAKSGIDYVTSVGQLTWADGNTSNKTISIPIIDNQTINGSRSLTLNLSGAAGASMGTPSQISITVKDNEVNVAGISLIAANLNGDGKDDLAAINSAGAISYTTNLTTWIKIPGTLKQLIAADINGDGKDELAGINSAGAIYYTTNLANWTKIPGTLTRLIAADLNGDGKDELVGINSAGAIYYTTNLANWTKIPGTLTRLIAADLNGDGKDELAGIDSAGAILYTTNFTNWIKIPGALSQLVAADINGDGKDELAGINSTGAIYYTTNLANWTRISGTLNYLIAADINGDGKDELAGINSAGTIFYSTNRTSWMTIPGTLTQLIAPDINGDGKNDLAGINSTGAIFYSTNLTSWTTIPGTRAQRQFTELGVSRSRATRLSNATDY
jgi:hypothetical protein